MAMNKTAAIYQAGKCVRISGKGGSWLICGPYSDTDPYGPCTELTAQCYRQAQFKAAIWKARVTLALMDKLTEDTDHRLNVASFGAWGHKSTACTRKLVEFALTKPHIRRR